MISRIPEETCLPDNDNFSAHDLLKKKKTQLKLRYQKVMRKKEKEEEEEEKRDRWSVYIKLVISIPEQVLPIFFYHNRIFFFFLLVNKGLDKIVPDLALEGKKSGMKRKLLFNE